MFRCLSIGLLASSIISAPLPAKALECPPGYVRAILYVPTCIKKAPKLKPLTEKEKARFKRRYMDFTEKEKETIQQELNETKP